jgi:probable F420-dependent oxidoreductase
MVLGELGVWTTYNAIGEENAGAAAALAESLGYGAFWLGGSPHLPALRPLLEGSERLVAATGILNVWREDPPGVAVQHAEMRREFPGRVMLGIGIGHPEATDEYAKPLTTMRNFFEGLDAAETPVPRDERCCAALGPKMLDFSAERSLGAHTYFTHVEHTRFARERLGDGPLIATELACVVDTDSERARAIARSYAEFYLRLRNYTTNLLRFDFTADDIADGGSDRLIDAVIPHGPADEIAAVVRQHLDAGADHVCLQPLGVDGVPHEEWAALASAARPG